MAIPAGLLPGVVSAAPSACASLPWKLAAPARESAGSRLGIVAGLALVSAPSQPVLAGSARSPGNRRERTLTREIAG